MKPATLFILLATVGITGAIGYQLGSRKPVAEPQQASVKAEPKIVYYRNPMGLPDTSPVPKKDAMGMDYIAVYEGEQDERHGNQVVLGPDKVQKLGVKSDAAALRVLDRAVRASGRIEIDEKRTYTITPKFEGWIERLYANTSGQAISKGQPLFDVYSPELASAQREYALAMQGLAAARETDSAAHMDMQRLADASRARLNNWGITDIQDRDAQSADTANTARTVVTFRSPVSGIVLEKKAVQGMRFMPGEILYQIADLSTVWVVAEIAEQDIGAVKLGSIVQVKVDAYPDKEFSGRIAFVYPTLNSATRTVQIRVELGNPNGLLKPAMFASVRIAAGNGGKVLTVPASAVIDSGTRQIVLVQLAQGRFEPRAVKLGARSEDHVEVLEGVAEGEQVVTSANFLIDAESNLKAALSGMGGDNTPAPGQSRHEGH